jgi:hypothetical protein
VSAAQQVVAVAFPHFSGVLPPQSLTAVFAAHAQSELAAHTP